MARSGNNSPRVTVYTVASRAGVSVATVSRVLQEPHRVKEATRARVQAAMDDLDYVPHGAARSLAFHQHEAHGLVLPELGGPYYSELLMGYESVAAAAGYSVVLLLSEGKDDLMVALRRLAGKVDGIVLMGAADVPERALAALRTKVPVLGLTRNDRTDLESFATENRSSAEELTRHLLAHGRERLVFVGSPEAAIDVRERYEGFAAAHDDRAFPAAVPAELRESEGSRVAELILSGEIDTDALVCANDELALAIMDHLVTRGVDIPREIAVVGWDDVMTARYVRPRLTTVAQPVRDLGARAAARMHDLIRGHTDTPDQHTLPTTVVIRQSCGCAAGDEAARLTARDTKE
ncbi:MAG: LacI family DNA-binding transcriptional regulator [Dermatophilaceae bacterium]|nr:LacI family transcriptional regulator [Intrasporangiaceae bacterium]